MGIGFVGHDYKWFIGQVPPNQLANKIERGAWGDRVRIKIPGYHSRGGEVDNDNLPWAIIAKPTSQGSYNYGSTGISGGEWVTGYFLDEDCQVPIITHVLGSNKIENTISLEEVKQAGTTYFKNVTRYNYGIPAQIHQSIGGSKPTQSAQPSIKNFQESKEKVDTTPIIKPITQTA